MTHLEPHIRLATRDDAGAVSTLISHFSDTHLLSPTAEEASAFFATISEPAIRALIGHTDMTYIVAEIYEALPLAGAAALRRDGLLFHLFVHASCQGRSLSRRLWECRRTRTYRSGCHGPFTVHASINAVPVCERFGFMASGARLMYLAPCAG